MIYSLRDLRSRAATAENPSAEPGRGGMAAGGLKGSPAIKDFRDGATHVLLDARGPGMVRRIWCTSHRREPIHLRNLILRMYWEGSEVPSVEAPLGDFFGVAHGAAVPMYSQYVWMQEGRGFNCAFPMPFAERAVVTIENATGDDIDWFFYEIDFTLGDEVGEDTGRFHASFRRGNPWPYGEDVTILETGGARGVFAGCVLGSRPVHEGWWGEGEVKMYIDGDGDFPTICGTGVEDYIGDAWGLAPHGTPTQGAPLVTGAFASLFRFHEHDPVYFRESIRVTVQQMGADLVENARRFYGDRLIYAPKNHPRRRPDDVFYLRSDDWCATAYWYQWPLVRTREPLPDRAARSADLFRPDPKPERPSAGL